MNTVMTLSRFRFVTLIVIVTFFHFYLNSLKLCGGKEEEEEKNNALTIDRIFVVSMQNTLSADSRNQGRFDQFMESWEKSCGHPIDVEYCHGINDPRRGFGLTLSFLLCLLRAKDMNLDVTIIFEDDARLNEMALDFCDADQRRMNYWSMLPKDAMLVFLGGHSWEYSNPPQGNKAQYRETSMSFGTYGYAVPKSGLRSLINAVEEDLVTGGHRDKNGLLVSSDYLSPEHNWYRAAKSIGMKIYSIDPLTVWHQGGFSNTWKKNERKYNRR